MNRHTLYAVIVSVVALLSDAASGHVILEGKSAEAGAPFVAAFRVGHGCAGSPTVKLQVRVPDGVVAVEPQAKEGWRVTSEFGAFDHATASGGQSFSEGARTVTWSGRSSPHEPATFVLKARLADDAEAGRKLIFPVYQQCEKGEERWLDADDKDDHPAPFLMIMPKR